MAETPDSTLLIAGGDRDPNVQYLLAQLEARGIAHRASLVGRDRTPTIIWEFEHDRLWIDGRLTHPCGVFLRHDVFEALADGRREPAERALAWYVALTGWLACHDDVRLFNRAYLGRFTNKLEVLQLASRCGLAIPATCVGNDLKALDRFCGGADKIAKPVAGGSLTRDYAQLRDRIPQRGAIAAAPAIVQRRLNAPEIRVYRVAAQLLAFCVDSPSLDYREHQDARLTELPIEQLPEHVRTGMFSLTERLGLNYAAADFKTDPDSGELTFLEVNSAAMFAAFDRVAGGRLCTAMVDWLAGDVRGDV